MLKRTALFEEHQRLGGRLVEFGGWEMPVQYSGVMQEHEAVRNAAGLFDVSHMGEVIIEGPGAEEFVNFAITNDITKIAVNQAVYSAMCHQNGGIVDDLVIYKTSPQSFFLVVNASNTDKDYAHLEKLKSSWSGPAFTMRNASPEFSQIALQGPKSETILKKLTETELSDIKNYWFKNGKVAGETALIARTGYTGEDGFEIYVPWNAGPKVWNALLEAGASEGIKPCGLGARDTLRLEMKYALYGNELSDNTNPLEVGLAWVTKLDKKDFYGKSSLDAAKTAGIQKALVGIKSLSRSIPRHGYPVYSVDGARIGEVTSGSSSPTLKIPVGVVFIDKAHSKVGNKILVEIRDQKHEFEIVKTPFVTTVGAKT